MKARRRIQQDPEIPMGPMIDMVFLLLVFFMVTAKPLKPESDIALGLPGTVTQEQSLDIPDEQQIQILGDGSVVLNELPVGSPGDPELAQLTAILHRFKETADANRSTPLVTIAADDACRHQRIVDVLNVCAKSKIKNVTFADADGGEEEEF